MEDGGSSPLRCQIDFHFTQTLLFTAGRPSPSNFHKQTLVYLFPDLLVYLLPLSHLLLRKQIEHNGKKGGKEREEKKQPQTTMTQLSLKTGTDFY